MIDPSTNQILARWQALSEGPGMRRAALTYRILSMVGLVLTIFVIYAWALHRNSNFTVATALVAGWVVAESNALRHRQSQWPIFKEYLDWNRVHQDLSDGT
jgi:hypothetical protein